MKLKLLSLTLALLMLLCAAGCGKTEPDPVEPTPPPATETPAPTETPTETADPEAEAAAAARLEKYSRAYAAYDPDTVVMRVDGRPVLWSEYFYWLYSVAATLEDYFDITDWSAEFPLLAEDAEEPLSYNAYVSRYAATNCLELAVLLNKAAELDAGLSAEQTETLDQTFEQFRSQADFADTLTEFFITEDYLRTQHEAAMIYENLFEQSFGKDGENCADADAVQYVTDQGYLYAKHILFKTTDDSNQPLDEATVAQKKADAEAVLAQLQAASAAELPALFDSLMQQHSEDPGLYSLPDGYYFRSGEMVASFEEAAKALEVGQLSGIVESDYGYHILFRPAMSADHLMNYDDSYQPYTVRGFAASALFSNVTYDWYDAAQVAYKTGFETLDLGALLAE